MSVITNITVEKGYADLEKLDNKSYLYPKLTAVNMGVATHIVKKIIKGIPTEVNMKQMAVAAMIWLDEYNHDHLWNYKAEVPFNVPLKGTSIPVLTANSSDKNRRHSHNPFGRVISGAQIRRPDIIIVKNQNIRWPGRAATYPTGEVYEDNLSRLVEIKFGRDDLRPEQERDYTKIAGGKDRFTVLKVTGYNPKMRRVPAEEPVPVYAPKPQAQGYFLENWVRKGERTLDTVLIGARNAYRYTSRQVSLYSDQAQKYLRANAPWLFEGGQMVRDAARKTWKWVNDKGQIVKEWTQKQLDQAIMTIKKATDLGIEELKKIDWMQVLMVGAQIILVIGIGIAVTFFSSGTGTAPYIAAVQTILTSLTLTTAVTR